MRGMRGARCALSLGKTSCPPCRSVGTRLDYAPCFGDWPGEVVAELTLPANPTGGPMSYMLDGKQYIVAAAATPETPAELVALALP